MVAPGGVLPRSEPGGHHRSPASGRFLSFAPIIFSVAVFAAGVWQRRWMSEDGFITLRVVAQILKGHGPVFNTGERVEASTSAAWPLILAMGDWATPVPLEVLAVVIGGVAAVGGLTLACLAARRLWTGGVGMPAGSLLVPCGALVVVAVAPFRDFATSGLETGLSFGWLGAAAYALAGEALFPGGSSRAWRRWWAPAVVGFGPLVRPDLALVAAPMLAALVVLRSPSGADRRLRLRSAGGVVAAGLAVPVAWQVFRMGYYGALVPNPALAKEGTEAWWSQGWRYLADLSRPYWLALPVSAGALVFAAGLGAPSGEATRARRRRVVALVAPAAGGLVHGFYVVRVGGDFMHARLLLPSLFAVLVPVMVIVPRRPLQWVLAGVVAIWAAVVGITVAGPTYPDPSAIIDERAYWVETSGRAHPIRVGDFSAQISWSAGDMVRRHLAEGGSGLVLRLDPGRSMISPATRATVSREEYGFVPMNPRYPERVGIENPYVGILGAVAGPGVRVVDVFGLSDPLAARLRLDGRGRFRPGHEKHLTREWVWARDVAAGTAPFDAGPSTVGAEAARRALACPPLQRLQRATTDPLTPGRFLGNLVDAVRLHHLRIDPDPVRAEKELCRNP